MCDSAKRMYRPQAYHHVQEIQKYNIQDYRPRYVFPQTNPVHHRFTFISKKVKSFSLHSANV
jgi:hypothetical protein